MIHLDVDLATKTNVSLGGIRKKTFLSFFFLDTVFLPR